MAKTVFIDGDPTLGVMGTKVVAAFLNLIFAHTHDGKDEDGSAPIDEEAQHNARRTAHFFEGR